MPESSRSVLSISKGLLLVPVPPGNSAAAVEQ